MTVTIEHRNPVEAKIQIKVPADLINQRLKDYYASLASKAKIPGFRPGKAPADVVKKMYGQEATSDLSERLISEFLMKAVQEHHLDLVMPPLLLATDSPTDDKDFNFEVEVHLKPQLPKVDLSSLQVEIPKTKEVTDDDVNEELKAIQEMDASYADIQEQRPAAANDCVVVTYSGELDGVRDPKMAAEQQTVVLGKGQMLPDFESGIVGMKIGETKTFPVSFPSDYHAAEIQGKTAQFTMTLNGIKEKVLAELNDAFAKSADESVQTLLELKLKIRAQLESTRERSALQQKRDAVGDALVEKHNFEVSKRQVLAMAERLAEQTHHMMHQMGMHHEETEEHAKALLDSSMKKAERDVRLTYILEAIARDQKFEVSPDDFKKRFEDTAKRTGYSVSQIQAYYAAKDEESTLSRMDRLKIDILDEKSLDYALSRATIKLKD